MQLSAELVLVDKLTFKINAQSIHTKRTNTQQNSRQQSTQKKPATLSTQQIL